MIGLLVMETVDNVEIRGLSMDRVWIQTLINQTPSLLLRAKVKIDKSIDI